MIFVMMKPHPFTSVAEAACQHAVRPSRRHVLLGLLASAAIPPAQGAAQTGLTDAAFHFVPFGIGMQDGSDWANAAPFSQITPLGSDAEPGQHFYFGVDAAMMPWDWEGPQVMWNAGGTPEAPTVLRFGMLTEERTFSLPDRPEAPAVFRMLGNETGPNERPDVGGEPYIRLGPACSHLRISGPAYDRSGGDGFFNFDTGGVIRDIGFSDIHARNVGRVIETEERTTIEGLSVQDCTALGMIRGFARFRDLSQAEFRDLDLDADFIDGGGGSVCQIISVTRGQDLHFSNLRLAKAINMLAAQERGSRYIQGDGLVLEEETRDVRIDNCHAADMGDGGFDLKSQNVHLTNCTTIRCKLGIRIWSHHLDNLIENCRMTEPVRRPYNDGSCLWVAGNVTLRDCVMESADNMSPIRFGTGQDKDRDGTIRIQGGQITHAEGVALAVGSEGTIELENVMINGVETSGRYRWTGRRMRPL